MVRNFDPQPKLDSAYKQVQAEAKAEGLQEFQQFQEVFKPKYTHGEDDYGELNFKLEDSPKAPPESDKVQFKVCLPDQQEFTFRMSMSDKMSKVLDTMKEKINKDSGFTLMFDGDKITETMTPKSLDMENGDKLDLYYVN